ncbi:hypothetical protein ACP_1618 [Acidobacterium capsulatum ATCC 51196]|uniref:Uncharacterized protein n=2 Tax=Acidobacteriaceae TaxID=204434 RepID=C1F764_ACIC5|nr:hypothetical protein ACP_1618 [Acidobacterium capsulatum ATCC 51196]
MMVKDYPTTLEAQLPAQSSNGVARMTEDVSLTRTAAAGSLVAGACLLMTGRRKGALLAAVAAGVLMAIDNPEAAAELWDRVPGYLRRAEDFVGRLEDTVAEVQVQGEKLKQTFAKR